LLVQRNVPVTFAKSPKAIINDTIEPEATPRILKAIPLHPSTKSTSSSGTRAQTTPSPLPVRRAISIEQGKKN
jgi:hypothetical protein